MNDYKVCLKCKSIRLKSEFSNDKYRSDGKTAYCKSCCKLKMKEWTKKNKAHTLKKSNDWYHAHKEHCKNYQIQNKKRRREYMKIWRKKNADRLKKYKKEYHRNVQSHSVDYRILHNLRTRLQQAIKGEKWARTMELVGCDIPTLKLYLESKFSSGMSWGNYGRMGWHIDHILPCHSFNLSLKEEQQKCFHYTNLQPLWAEDNCRKNKFISPEYSYQYPPEHNSEH